ncbi:FAD/NAD(P)-binding protein [Streptomyces sp. TRM 70351]|uniref:FAD/NAD(P)-binding protein n=1 Tax=Streptomyces sp. TRM 70351 TaxID=3116552 RepID=UPI002E7B5B86|nr:FAD/NAD(P)-binding protein [Streptomyces sp. TRM 70351]MEE1927325.1 FAD/NAD(P)-binding protein [Streptomyces sp. TRM 70351]
MNRNVAIVGAGATAVGVFARLAGADGLSQVCLIDPRPAGLGVAFGTSDPALLCNTSADVTSLDPDGESGLLRHLSARGWPVRREDFVPRHLVGQYLREEFLARRAQARARGVRVRQAADRATAVRRAGGGYAVELAGGGRVTATDVLLCPGLEQPRLPAVLARHAGRPRLLTSPYPVERLRALPPSARVLVLGSKLSAIDAALVLCRDGRTVTMASPSGRLPAVRTRLTRQDTPRLDHAAWAAHHPDDPDLDGLVLRGVLRAMAAAGGGRPRWRAPRDEAGALQRLDGDLARAEAGALPWQDLVAEIIDLVNETTAGWDPAHRSAVLARHAEPVSRYISAIPLANARLLAGHLAKGTLTVTAGIPETVTARPDGFTVRWPDGTQGVVDHIVCATGFGKPALHTTPGRDGVLLGDGPDGPGGRAPREAPELTERLRLRFAPGAPEERVWVLGAASHPRAAIVNYLRTAALQARLVGDQLARRPAPARTSRPPRTSRPTDGRPPA